MLLSAGSINIKGILSPSIETSLSESSLVCRRRLAASDGWCGGADGRWSIWSILALSIWRHCLELEPLFELRDPLQLSVLLVEEVAELLLVFACFAQIPLVVAPCAVVPDASPQEPQRHPHEAEEEHCDDENYHRAHFLSLSLIHI